jgi:hypothetical protein
MSRFLELCSLEPRLAELHREALEVAAWSGGNLGQICERWHSNQNQTGLKAKMILLLREPNVARELQSRLAYYDCYSGLWEAICSTRRRQT